MLETMGTALLPVVILMLLGWLGGRRGHFQRADVAVLATFVTRYALPFSLFLGALRTPPQKLQNLPFVACMLFGFLGMLLPEEWDGLGLDSASYLAALEEIAWGDASVAVAMPSGVR